MSVNCHLNTISRELDKLEHYVEMDADPFEKEYLSDILFKINECIINIRKEISTY